MEKEPLKENDALAPLTHDEETGTIDEPEEDDELVAVEEYERKRQEKERRRLSEDKDNQSTEPDAEEPTETEREREALSIDDGSESRVIIKRSCRPTLKCCGFCLGISIVLGILSWLIVIVPLVKKIIAYKTLNAPMTVLVSPISMDKEKPIINVQALHGFVPKSAWDMGFPLNLATFEATIPPTEVALFAHLDVEDNDGNPTVHIVRSGNFTIANSLTLKSWEDLDAKIAGTLNPELDQIQPLMKQIFNKPEMTAHIEATVDISATMMGFFPCSITNTHIVSAAIAIPAINGFKDNWIVVQSIDRVVGVKEGVQVGLTAVVNNPMPFTSELDGTLKIGGLFDGHPLGTVTVHGLSLPPPGVVKPVKVEFEYFPTGTPEDKAAFNGAIIQMEDNPIGFKPLCGSPLKVGCGPPPNGEKPSEYPLINTALSGDFTAESLVKLPEMKLLTSVDLYIPTLSIAWNGLTLSIGMNNPVPTPLYIDSITADIYWENINGMKIYRLNSIWSLDDMERPHIDPLSAEQVSIECPKSGVDSQAIKLAEELFSRFIHGNLHNATVGLDANFTISLQDFQVTIPYRNQALTAQLHVKA